MQSLLPACIALKYHRNEMKYVTLVAALQVPYVFANEARRSGAYYLPSQYRVRILPLMLVFHGLEGNGVGMVNTFKVHVAITGVDHYLWSICK